MADANISQYHKYIDLQNVSGSGDPSSAPNGGIYLFASGTVGNAKLYLQNEGVSTPLSLADGGTLQIQGDSGTDTVNLQSDTFTFAGGEGVVSTVTDNQVSLAVSVADFTSAMTGDLEDTDEFAISDGGSMKRVDFSVVRDAVFADVTGDAAIAAGGALTIGGDAVESGMLNDNVISGQTELAHADIADADELMISDGGVLKKVGVDSLRDHFFGVVSGDAAIADGGALTIQAGAVEHAMLANDAVDGDNIADDAVNSEHIALGALDSEHYATGSIESNHLKGSVANAKLANSSVTVTAGDGLKDGGEVALGASVTLNVDVSEFAGTGLEDDGSENLRIAAAAAGDGLTGGAGSALALDIGGMATPMTGDLEDTDEFAISDGGSMKKVDFSVVRDAVFADVSTDVQIAAGGAATIQNDVVTNAKLANIARGSVKVGGASNAPTDLDAKASGQILVGDGTDINSVAVSGDVALAANGAVTIQTGAVEHAMLANDAVDGDNIANDAVNSEHIALGALDSEHYSTGSIESNHLKGSVANAKLANSAVTLGSTSVSLGATTDTIAGLLQLTSSFMQVGTGVFPDVAGGATLGKASLGFGDVFIADDKTLSFGNDQDVRMEYDEDGNDEFKVTIPAAGMRLQGSTPTLIVGDGGGEDTKILFDGQAVDFHVGLDHDNQKLSLGLGSTVGSSANMLLASANRDVEFLGNISLPQTKRIDLDTDGDTSIRASEDDVIKFEAGGSDIVTINALGIGTANGAGFGGASIGFDGTGNFDGGLIVGQDAQGDAAGGMRVHGSATGEEMIFSVPNNNLSFKYHDGSSQATIMTLGGDESDDFAIEVAQGSANINKIKASAFVTYSDESLKSDISSMANTALDTVMSLEGVEFTWKNSGERDFGFIAQDVQKVVPQAVHVASNGVQGVDYSRLTSVLVEAVKAQQVQIEELKALLKK